MRPGFSLVEVLITLGVISITSLVAISVFRFQANSNAFIKAQAEINDKVYRVSLLLKDQDVCDANISNLKKKTFATKSAAKTKLNFDRIDTAVATNPPILQVGVKGPNRITPLSIRLEDIQSTAKAGLYSSTIRMKLTHSGNELTKNGLVREIPFFFTGNTVAGVVTVDKCFVGDVDDPDVPDIPAALGEPMFPQYVVCTGGGNSSLFHIGACDAASRCSYRLLLRTNDSHSVRYNDNGAGAATKSKHNGRGKHCPLTFPLDGSKLQP